MNLLLFLFALACSVAAILTNDVWWLVPPLWLYGWFVVWILWRWRRWEPEPPDG